ncbi:MAG: hypothetical protein AAGC77_05440 [Pseudomonadota bacterium]
MKVGKSTALRLNGVIASALVVALLSTPSAVAASGGWRFHPERCPDLREDYRDRAESRRDRRVNHGPLDRLEDRLDRRESRRDERVTICPASSWVWHGTSRSGRAARPAAATIYYDPYNRRYFRYGHRNRRISIVIR